MYIYMSLPVAHSTSSLLAAFQSRPCIPSFESTPMCPLYFSRRIAAHLCGLMIRAHVGLWHGKAAATVMLSAAASGCVGTEVQRLPRVSQSERSLCRNCQRTTSERQPSPHATHNLQRQGDVHADGHHIGAPLQARLLDRNIRAQNASV
jgi:hypothetical protein